MGPNKTYSIVKARYAKGKLVILIPSDGSGFKTGLMYLAEGVGGKWVHRSNGYTVSPVQAQLFEFLAGRGYTCGMMIGKWAEPEFKDPIGRKFTLREVKSKMRGLTH